MSSGHLAPKISGIGPDHRITAHINAASQNNHDLRLALDKVDNWMGLIDSYLNINPSKNAATIITAPPPLANFSVGSRDGVFIIDVVNPAVIQALTATVATARAARGQAISGAQNNTLYHQLQSSTNTAFDATGNVQTYGGNGGSSSLHFEIRDPNVQKYWRLRSKFGNSDWNAWQIAGSPLVCGPLAVYSGLLTTASLTFLNSGYTPKTTPALVQVGNSTQIEAVPNTWTVGSGPNLVYSAAFVDPGAYGGFFIYGSDPRKAGGVILLFATQTQSDITASDGTLYIGFITTKNSGGASGGQGGVGGGGSGSGPCPIGDVMVTMADGSLKLARDCRKGDKMRGADGGIETLLVHPHMTGGVPCFRLTGENGMVLEGVSGFHGLMLECGSIIKVDDLIDGMKVLTTKGATAVTKEFIGRKVIFRFHFDRSKTYITDGYLSHNAVKI